MDKIDFIELATYSTEKYKETHNRNDVRYIHTLYVAIDEDNNVKCSKTPHVLKGAVQCLLIHHNQIWSEKADWYSWDDVEYIDKEGCVLERNLGGKFDIQTSASASVMTLSYNGQELYSCYTPGKTTLVKYGTYIVRLKI